MVFWFLPPVYLCCGLFGSKISLLLIIIYSFLRMLMATLSMNYPLCMNIHGPAAFGQFLFGIKFFECVVAIMLCMLSACMLVLLFRMVPLMRESYIFLAVVLSGFSVTYWTLHFSYTIMREEGCTLCVRYDEIEDEVYRRYNVTLWTAFNKTVIAYEREREWFRTSNTPYPLYYWYYNSARWTTPSRLPCTPFTPPPFKRGTTRVKNYTEANGYNNECLQWVKFEKGFDVRWMTLACPLWAYLEALVQVYFAMVINSYEIHYG